MTTILNSPREGSSETGTAFGLIIGLIVTVGIIALFFYYGLPAIQGTNQVPKAADETNINLQLPSAPANDTEVKAE
jgi:hypothetical protein